MNNLSSFCGLTDSRMSASDTDLPVLLVSAELTIGATLKHKNTQHLYIFNRIRVLHLNRLKGTRYLCKTKLSFLAVLKSYHFMLN